MTQYIQSQTFCLWIMTAFLSCGFVWILHIAAVRLSLITGQRSIHVDYTFSQVDQMGPNRRLFIYFFLCIAIASLLLFLLRRNCAFTQLDLSQSAIFQSVFGGAYGDVNYSARGHHTSLLPAWFKKKKKDKMTFLRSSSAKSFSSLEQNGMFPHLQKKRSVQSVVV